MPREGAASLEEVVSRSVVLLQPVGSIAMAISQWMDRNQEVEMLPEAANHPAARREELGALLKM